MFHKDALWPEETIRTLKAAPAAVSAAGKVKLWVSSPETWREELEEERNELQRNRDLDVAYLKETEYVPVLLYDSVCGVLTGQMNTS